MKKTVLLGGENCAPSHLPKPLTHQAKTLTYLAFFRVSGTALGAGHSTERRQDAGPSAGRHPRRIKYFILTDSVLATSGLKSEVIRSTGHTLDPFLGFLVFTLDVRTRTTNRKVVSTGRLNPVTPVHVPLPKIFVVFGTTIFARSSNADTCIFTCVPVTTCWL